MNQRTHDYLAFRRMITPAIIQVLFWIVVGIVVLSGVIGVCLSLLMMLNQSFAMGLLAALLNILWIIIMPIIVRIYFELIILFFRMNETLTEIKNNTTPARAV